MTKQPRSAKTLSLLPTSNMPRLAKLIKIEQKALSSLQNYFQIYIHNRYDRSFGELFSVYRQMFCKQLHQFRLYMIPVIEV